MEYKNNYPVVICHGLMGWGEQDLVDKTFPHFGLTKEKDLSPLFAGGHGITKKSPPMEGSFFMLLTARRRRRGLRRVWLRSRSLRRRR